MAIKLIGEWNPKSVEGRYAGIVKPRLNRLDVSSVIATHLMHSLSQYGVWRHLIYPFYIST